MTEKKITIDALNIDPAIYFSGAEEDIQNAEKIEAARAAEIERLVFCPSFLAMEYRTHHGARRILHHSTRPGVAFQLSYIDADGVPSMHENYIRTGEKADGAHIGNRAELLRHYVNQTLRKDITLTILSA